MLHAHVQHVGRIACDSAEEARGRGHGNEGGERGRRACGRENIFKLFINSKTGGRVGELTKN